MKLCDLQAGKKAKIQKISEQKEIKIKLATLGLNVDSEIMMVKNDFNGAIIVAIEDNRIILDKELAEKIDVKIL